MTYDLHGAWDHKTGINAPFISGDSLNVVRVNFLSYVRYKHGLIYKRATYRAFMDHLKGNLNFCTISKIAAAQYMITNNKIRIDRPIYLFTNWAKM